MATESTRISTEEERLRAMPLPVVLTWLNAVQDNNNPERWITPRGGVYFVRSSRFACPERRKHGDGAISLVASILDLDFRQAIGTLRQIEEGRPSNPIHGFRSELAAARFSRSLLSEAPQPVTTAAEHLEAAPAGPAVLSEPTGLPAANDQPVDIQQLFAGSVEFALDAAASDSLPLSVSPSPSEATVPAATPGAEIPGENPGAGSNEPAELEPTFADTLRELIEPRLASHEPAPLRDELEPLPDAPPPPPAAESDRAPPPQQDGDPGPAAEDPAATPPATGAPVAATAVPVKGRPLLPGRGSLDQQRQVATYLVVQCRVNAKLVTNLIRNGVIYADHDGHAVFLLRSPTGSVVGAEIKACDDGGGVLTQHTRPRLSPGSQTDRGSFFITRETSSRIVITSTALEALCYSSLAPNDTVVSLSGCVNPRLLEWLGPRLMRSALPIYAALPDTDDGRFGAEQLEQAVGAHPYFPSDRLRNNPALREHALTWRSLLFWADEAVRQRQNKPAPAAAKPRAEEHAEPEGPVAA